MTTAPHLCASARAITADWLQFFRSAGGMGLAGLGAVMAARPAVVGQFELQRSVWCW